MTEWIVCPSCQLHHSVRPTRACPRCGQCVDGGAIPAAPLAAPESAAAAGAQEPSRLADAPADPSPGTVRCTNHPDVTDGVVSCRRCGRPFCRDCVVALRGTFFCVDCKDEQVRDIQSGALDRKLRATECIGYGWQLVKGSYWPLWTVGLVFLAVSVGVALLGAVPLIGGVFQLAATFFVNPPLQAGLAYAMRRAADGAPADTADLFEGFRSQYWQSIIVMLPVLGAYFLAVMVLVIGFVAFMFGIESAHTDARQALTVVGLTLLALFMLVFMIVAMFVNSAVWFAYVELWDGPSSGWTALVTGLRVAKDNLRSTFGMSIMLGMIALAAIVVGVLALCVGLLFTIPALTVWAALTHVYAYRSWSRARTADGS